MQFTIVLVGALSALAILGCENTSKSPARDTRDKKSDSAQDAVSRVIHSGNVLYLKSEKDLPKCEKTNFGFVYFLADTSKFLVCDQNGSYQEVDLKGVKGEKGDKGDSGDKGDKGDTGDKGDKGDTGDKGDKGDTGDKGDKGNDGSSGLNSLIRTVALLPPEPCLEGGILISVGLDRNANGVLESTEVASTATICNGVSAPKAGAAGVLDEQFGSNGYINPSTTLSQVISIKVAGTDIYAFAEARSTNEYSCVRRYNKSGVDSGNNFCRKTKGSSDPINQSWPVLDFLPSPDFVALAQGGGVPPSGYVHVFRAPNWQSSIEFDSSKLPQTPGYPTEVSAVHLLTTGSDLTFVGRAKFSEFVYAPYFFRAGSGFKRFADDRYITNVLSGRGKIAYCSTHRSNNGTNFKIEALDASLSEASIPRTVADASTFAPLFDASQLYCNNVYHSQRHGFYFLVTNISGGKALLKLDPEGNLDSRFGVNGKLQSTHFSGEIGDLAVQDDGNILLAVRGDVGIPGKIVRIKPDGSLDASFGMNGKFEVNALSQIELDSDQRIVFFANRIGVLK
jgi:hypothetical protein